MDFYQHFSSAKTKIIHSVYSGATRKNLVKCQHMKLMSALSSNVECFPTNQILFIRFGVRWSKVMLICFKKNDRIQSTIACMSEWHWTYPFYNEMEFECMRKNLQLVFFISFLVFLQRVPKRQHIFHHINSNRMNHFSQIVLLLFKSKNGYRCRSRKFSDHFEWGKLH